MNPFLLPCPHCEDGTIWRARRGGNSPNTRLIGPCDTCEATGAVPLSCALCYDPAVEFVAEMPLCRAHGEEARADMIAMGEG